MDNLGLLLLGLAALGLSHKEFLGNAHHLVGAVAVEDNHVINVGTVAHKLVLLQRGAYEALLAVDVELLVGLHHLGGGNGVEVLDFGLARVLLAILALDELKPLAGDLHHIGQFTVNLLHFGLHAGNVLLGLVLVELQYAPHLDFHQAQDIIARHLPHQPGIPGLQAAVNPRYRRVHVLGILKLAVLIDALLNEYLFERGKQQALQQLSPAYETLLAQQLQRGVHIVA